MPGLNIEKVCVIRLGGFGDILIFTHHVLSTAREKFPGARIDYVVAREFVPLLEGCDYVDRVIGHERTGGLKGLFPFLKFCSMLRAENYDLIIDLHDNTRSRLITRLARPKNSAFSFPDHEDYNPSFTKEEITRRYGIEFPDDRFPLWLSPADRDYIFSLQENLSGPVIGLCLVGSWESKRWPAEHFATLGNNLVEETGASIILVGGPSDVPYAEEVEKRMPGGKVKNLAGKTSLSRSIALTLLCSVIVSNDSGMLHAAYLSRVPLVGLFGCTDPEAFGHPGPRSIALSSGMECSPCHKPVCPLGTTECMTALSPERVYSAVIELLEKTPGNIS